MATPPTSTPLGDVAALMDGGEMDCGSGLLLLITRAMRRLDEGDLLGVRSAEPSVVTDLPVWADLVGHEVVDVHADGDSGPWWFAVRKVVRPQPDTMFTLGARTPVGQRLWVYTNFDCNLACTYCCAQSSPKAPARRLTPEVAAEAFSEFQSLGGAEVFLTGGGRSCILSSQSWCRRPTALIERFSPMR